MSALKSLASSKIHCVNSTAKGEIVYARYVYAHTGDEDTTVRAPIASFWATRSHTLRSEAEAEFKSLCLEYPQFGYDVLSKPIPRCVVATSDGLANSVQRASWTTSSSGSATRRCTPLRIAGASGRVIAVAVRSERSNLSRFCILVGELGGPGSGLYTTPYSGSATTDFVAMFEVVPHTILGGSGLRRTGSNVHRSRLGRRWTRGFPQMCTKYQDVHMEPGCVSTEFASFSFIDGFIGG